MAVIAIFLGVLGMALSRGDSTVATQSAQRTIAGLVTGARAQAILKQAPVRLIVHNDPPLASDPPEVQQEKKERYLRYIGLVFLHVDTTTNPPSASWKPVNEGVFLPQGVYVVPPRQLDPPTSNPPPEVISDNDADWAHARRSVVSVNTRDYDFNSGLNSPNNEQTYFSIELDGRGMVRTGQFPPGDNEGRLVVAPAVETPTTPRFENEGDSYVLGGVLRRYGSLTLIHEPAAFPEIKNPR